jgi:hypothetical protein
MAGAMRRLAALRQPPPDCRTHRHHLVVVERNEVGEVTQASEKSEVILTVVDGETIIAQGVRHALF